MNLFKNKVGRPSNKMLEKKRKFYTIITIICAVVVGMFGYASYNFNNKIESKNKNASSICVMPYTKNKCRYVKNDTVKKIQEMLVKEGHYKKSDGIDGYFGPKTESAVKAFQRSKGLGVDGYVGPGTLEELAKATNTKYFKIKYDKAGGTGSLNSQYNNIQVILNGINTKISSTTLRKNKYTHVGYTVTSTIGTTKYRYGCFNKNCSSGSKPYTEAQIKANKNTFYDVVYSIGVGVSQTGWEKGQTITFTAKYCPSGQTYNKKTSSCERIPKKTLTATFVADNLDYISSQKVSCNLYNNEKSCEITLPTYNKKGRFNSYWSSVKLPSTNLKGYEWKWEYYNKVNSKYTLTSNMIFYPNFNGFHYDLNDIASKYRNFDIVKSITIGKTLFEFERGIQNNAINEFIEQMQKAYKQMSFLFVPAKIFVMTENTYNNYSVEYGLTQIWELASYSSIDLKFDTIGIENEFIKPNSISVNAALHELAHAWGAKYKYETNGSKELFEISDFNSFYNTIKSKLYSIDPEWKGEVFAGMVTNYYWHVLGNNKQNVYYALADGKTLSSSDLQKLKTFMEKYIKFSNNDYK